MYPQYTKIPLEGHNLPSSGIFFFDFVSNVSRLNDKRPAQQTSSLRATAHHKFITAFGNAHGIALRIPPHQLFIAQIKLYIDRLSCRDMYPFESTQCLARSFDIIVFLQIDLHNLFTVTFAGIGYGDIQSQFLTGLYIIRTKHHSAITERGLAQSMTEGEQRFLGHVTVSPTGHIIILKIRKL